MPAGRPKKVVLVAEDVIATSLEDTLARTTKITFPNARYREDPVAYCREILGVEPWAKQVEILESVRDHKRVAVRSGNKVGKTRSATILASWFYDSYPDARVTMTSTTDRQVNTILWRELRKVRAGMGRCVDCKRDDPDGPKPCPHSAVSPGVMGELARTGLKSEDFREITGYTAKEPEAIAGISGANMLYIVDEASGVPDVIFEAIEGNRAAGARILLISNPTRNEGEFYNAFTNKKEEYHTITVSSEETPNVVEDRIVIPGLAGREWVEEKKREWGENSSLYKVRVKGEHALHEDGRIFSIHAIGQAEEAWEDTPAEGLLQLGLDPAGPSGTGDESAFSLRRGLKQLHLSASLGLTEEGHLVQVLALLRDHRTPTEVPLVVIDREGSVGAKVYGLLSAHEETHPRDFRLVAVRASDRAQREGHLYDRMRDGLVQNLFGWIKDGGAIITDRKLATEMHQFEWFQHAMNGKYKVTPKDKIKKEIGRSPDRFDALALSVWEPTWLKEEQGAPASAPAAQGGVDTYESGGMDPYAGSRAFRR